MLTKKYYDGFIVHDILDAHLKSGKMLEVLKAFAEVNGVDAVEVIRCRDCKYAKKIYIKNLPWLKQWEYSCSYFNTHSVNGDGFCSLARPRD